MNSIDKVHVSMPNNNGDTRSHTENVALIDALLVLARHKKLTFGMPLVAALLSSAISFALPASYVATTKLLPPQQAQSSAAALLSQLGSVAGAVAGTAGLKNPSDIYVGMLKSRRIADGLVNRFGLKTAYETDSQEKARQYLEDHTVISIGKDGFITIDVEDRDKKRVAQLANGYVEELMRLSSSFAITEASQRRVFYEHQLDIAKTKLTEAEIALRAAIEKSGVVSVDSESRAAVETIARLRAQISAKEIQMNSMRAFVTENNIDFLRAEHELASLKAELSKLENGRTGENLGGESGSSKGLESVGLLREVKYRQTLYELLVKQFEIARLDEAKDLPTIQILDPAVEPERRAKPKRLFIVLGATILALLTGLVAAFLSESRRNAGDDAREKWRELRRLIKPNNPAQRNSQSN